MKDKIPLILRFVFGGLLVFAVLVFADLIPKPSEPAEKGELIGTVTIWGSFPEQEMEEVLRQFYSSQKVEYVEKNAETFDGELIEAIAGRVGPDVILLPEDLIIKRQGSIERISYELMSKGTFKNTYLRQGEIYLQPKGILALPFAVDPMVMYWNRDMFAAEGLVEPPQYWDQMYKLAPVLTKRTDDGTITQSLVAFGEYRNVMNAKDIISMLILQQGNPIVRITPDGTHSTLSGKSSLGIPSAKKALEFYTNFSDPRLREYYSWNRGLSGSRQMFVNQNLAIYFDYASEYSDIQRINPLLSFDVAVVPQIRGANFDATIGKMYGVSILASSDNRQEAYQVAFTLASAPFSRAISEKTFLPPVHRGLYQEKQSLSAFQSVFYDSAIISRGWPDPAPEETSRIFREAVESIVSGASSIERAVTKMDQELEVLLGQVLSMTIFNGFLARMNS